MASHKSILCIVPQSPPISGAAIASETLINYLKRRHDVVTLPYQRGNLISGRFSAKQFFRIMIIGINVTLLKLRRNHFDSVYLIISSSFWGNLRDIFLLLLIGKKMRTKTVLHLHGANIDRYFSSVPFPLKWLNKRVMENVKSAIVLGETFNNIFDGYIARDKIQIVHNFVTHNLFIPKEKVDIKFEPLKKINILFLSNLIEEKGYKITLDAFLSLNENIREKTMLHFAGNFYSHIEESSFVEKIKNNPDIVYHGQVSGEEKKNLLWNAHIFCFPSYFHEGQPISILESYASGCVVITTRTGGIIDIFVDKKNGFFIETKDTNSLREKLELLVLNMDKYKHIAKFNTKESLKYTEKKYCEMMEAILANNHEAKQEFALRKL